MKPVVALLILFSTATQILAQDTTSVFVNNNKVGQTISRMGQKETIIVLKKSIFKTYHSFVIQIKGENTGGPGYKTDLEITGDSTVIISEIKDKPGNFDITKTNTKKQLLTGKILKLYLVLNPSNSRMMRPSKKIYLGNIMMK